MLARSFLIESSSKLLVTRTGIKAWTSLILGMIRLLTSELLALEWRKFYTFELEYLWGQLANLDQILCVASLRVEKGCIMFWGRLDQNSGVHGNRKPPLTYNGEKVSPPFLGCFWSTYNGENCVSTFLAHLSRRLTRWAYSIAMVRRPSVVVRRRHPHFQTCISLKPAGQPRSNFICSITGVGERLHKVLGQIRSNLWFPWQQKAPIDL